MQRLQRLQLYLRLELTIEVTVLVVIVTKRGPMVRCLWLVSGISAGSLANLIPGMRRLVTNVRLIAIERIAQCWIWHILIMEWM